MAGLSGNFQRNIRSLTITKNTGDEYSFGDTGSGTQFNIPLLEGKIVGLFAHSGTVLNAIGAYVAP